MFMQGPLRCVKRAEGAAGCLGSCLLSLLQKDNQPDEDALALVQQFNSDRVHARSFKPREP